MENNELENVLISEGIFAKGFGNIGNIVMQDRRITPYSKAIYAYFCSYAGGGSTAFPSVSKIIYDLKMDKKTYYKHFNALVECGYISVHQMKREGKFSKNIYKINTNPKKALKTAEQPKKDEKEIPSDFYYDWMAE